MGEEDARLDFSRGYTGYRTYGNTHYDAAFREEMDRLKEGR
jgi:hypothetical protein